MAANQNRYVALVEYGLTCDVQFESLIDKDGSLLIKLFGRDDAFSAEIEFPHYRTYRKSDEGDQLLTLTKLADVENSSMFLYEVFDSDFLDWYRQQTYGQMESFKPRHFFLSFLNDLIDVIAINPPKLRRSDRMQPAYG
jgi:hypothetical protein